MNKTKKHDDFSMRVGRGWSNLTNESYLCTLDGELLEWTEGEVVTEYGIVLVYAEEGTTTLRFVWNGTCYDRYWDYLLGKRTIARLAKEFVKEIVSL
jgi:hypothetical protein